MSTFFVKHVDIFENIEVNVNIYSKIGLEKVFSRVNVDISVKIQDYVNISGRYHPQLPLKFINEPASQVSPRPSFAHPFRSSLSTIQCK